MRRDSLARRGGVILAFCGAFVALLSSALIPAGVAQQPFRASDGRQVGSLFTVRSRAPYVVLIGNGQESATRLPELARRFNNLGTNVLAITDIPIYNDPLASPDTLIADLGWRLSQLKKRTSAPILLVGERRSASLALILATIDFRVKGVIALSAGEYFSERQYVKESISKLRVPVLLLYTSREKGVVKELVSELPQGLLLYAEELTSSGFQNLLSESRASGSAWLAITLFYNDLFGDQ